MKRVTGWGVGVVFTGLALMGGGSLMGCNVLTGAGDLRIGDGDGEGPDGSASSGSSSAASGGATGSGGASASSSTGSNMTGGGGDGPIEAPMALADGAYVTDIDLYQAVRRPLVSDGAAANSDIPVVAGKTALLRVFYETDGSYNGQLVTARLTVGGADPLELEQTLSGSSSQSDLGSTINFDVPGELLLAGSDYRVELLQPSADVAGGNTDASYPRGEGTADMQVEQGAVKLKIVLVPVQYNGSLPDTSTEQVALYHRYFSEIYPVPEVEVTVRSQAHSFGGGLGSYNGWSNLLDQITDLRSQDGAPSETYYYGIHNASGSSLLGLGWVGGANDSRLRAAIGVGWTGETAPETAVHELGHNHGRPHSPCGVSGDAAYPHSGARIGVWGYRPSDNRLLDPDDYVDFMSYCDPAWISDWTFKKIFDRAKVVSTQPLVVVPEHLQNRTYDRIKMIDGVSYFKDTVVLPKPPLGQQVTIDAIVDGQPQSLEGSYNAYDHIDGGIMLVMRPRGPHARPFAQAAFTAGGHSYAITR